MAKSTDLETQAADDVAALIARCEAVSPETLPLDKSFVSLDRVEDFLRAHPEEQAKVASYLGATLIEHAGGRWEPPKPNSDDGDEPLITKLAIIPKARFYPSEVTHTALRLSRSVIRDAVERHDIKHRRAVLAEQLARLTEELEALRADIGRLTGNTPEALDDSPAALSSVEDALVALITNTASREEVRRVRSRVVLFIGDLVQRRIGGAWTVCEDPRGDSLGEFESHGWAPAPAMENVAASNRGIFERTLPLVYKRGVPARRRTMTGRWEVYCSNERAISLDVLATELSDQEIKRDGDKLIVVARDTPTSPPAEVEVTIERGAAVREAAEELAERNLSIEPGVPAPDLDALRASDVRYLLDYDADKHYELVNALILTAGALENTCGGIIYDATSDRFA